jgi:hypothetical protein
MDRLGSPVPLAFERLDDLIGGDRAFSQTAFITTSSASEIRGKACVRRFGFIDILRM